MNAKRQAHKAKVMGQVRARREFVRSKRPPTYRVVGISLPARRARWVDGLAAALKGAGLRCWSRSGVIQAAIDRVAALKARR